jgi:pantothenate kinase
VRNLRVPLPPSRSHTESAVKPVIAPSFDHAVKDPDPTGVKVFPWHKIVVIEGLYCFLSIGAWKEAGEMLDERWLTTVDFEEATERIIDRHVTSGVAGSIEVPLTTQYTPQVYRSRGPQEAQWRARENDMPSESMPTR